jgi:hypothetical protein
MLVYVPFINLLLIFLVWFQALKLCILVMEFCGEEDDC